MEENRDLVKIPRDLGKIKAKVVMGLTKRQLICFGLGAALGLPAFFAAKPFTGAGPASAVMILIMIPAFLFALYEKDGRPLEKVIYDAVRFRRLVPRERPYRVTNIYTKLYEQEALERKIHEIYKG